MTKKKEFDPEGKVSMHDFPMGDFEKFIRNQIANELEKQAFDAMVSNEYSFNDTAVRAKTFYYTAQYVRGLSND